MSMSDEKLSEQLKRYHTERLLLSSLRKIETYVSVPERITTCSVVTQTGGVYTASVTFGESSTDLGRAAATNKAMSMLRNSITVSRSIQSK